MEIVIKIHDEDLMQHPEIFDTLKDCAKKIADGRPELFGYCEPEPIGFAPASAEGVEPVDLGDCIPEIDDIDPVDPEPEAPAEPEQEVPAEPEQEEAPVAEEGAEIVVSIEEVRAAIAQVNKKHGAKKAKAILQKFGAESMSALDKKHYAAALKEAKGAL